MPDTATITEDRERRFAERLVAIESYIRSLREIMQARFEAVDSRLEALERVFDARFSAVDSRFEAVDSRIDALSKEIAGLRESVSKEIAGLRESVNKRFGMIMWFFGIVSTSGITLLVLILRELLTL
ncbi:MAG: hypothetical protein OXU68_10735 [Bacteroidota bacterium]|nr:hypothetical protein [Bacteroidota bacterium]